MSQIQLDEFSYKIIRKSSNFLRSVWRESPKLDIEANVYHDYYKTGNNNYVNDFLCKSWKTTSDLSPEQVLCIHEDNKVYANAYNVSKYNRKEFQADDSYRKTSYYTISKESRISMYFADMEVTDDYLDSYQIPKGNIEERMALLKKHSDIFSRFLCLHIGTERIVKFRRALLNKVMNSILDNDDALIGSISEGLDMTGSDIDILSCAGQAHEKGHGSYNAHTKYEYDSLKNNMNPGYVMIEVKGYTEMCLFSNEIQELRYAKSNKKSSKNVCKTEKHVPVGSSRYHENDKD